MGSISHKLLLYVLRCDANQIVPCSITPIEIACCPHLIAAQRAVPMSGHALAHLYAEQSYTPCPSRESALAQPTDDVYIDIATHITSPANEMVNMLAKASQPSPPSSLKQSGKLAQRRLPRCCKLHSAIPVSMLMLLPRHECSCCTCKTNSRQDMRISADS